jgi:ATP-dependent Clp protease protease subunit
MGSIILLACDEDKRLMLPSSRVMLHDCSWGRHEMGGKKPHEVEEELNQLKKTNERLVSIIAKRTGKTVKQVSKITRYDSFFSAEEAIEFGLASKVMDTDELTKILGKGA